MNLEIQSLRRAEAATLRLRGLYESYGYRKYRMGRFEEYSLYAANKSFLLGENVPTFTDLDGRLMALKPDVTLSIAKNTKADKNTCEKVYYLESVYRESKESHTYKEISQMGLECMGGVDDCVIAEVLALALKSLADFETDYVLKISNMDFVVGLMEELPVNADQKDIILGLIRTKNRSGLEKLCADLALPEGDTEKLMKVSGLYGEFGRVLAEAGAIADTPKMKEAVALLSRLYEVLEAMGLGGQLDKVRLDFSMINDIEYYNGIIFQGFLDGLARQVLSGGKVDGGLAAHGGVHLGEEGGGDLDVIHPPQHGGGGKSRQVAHHAAAQGDDPVGAGEAGGHHGFPQLLQPRHRFAVLPGGDGVDGAGKARPLQAFPHGIGVQGAHGAVGDHKDLGRPGQQGAHPLPGAGEEPPLNFNVVGPSGQVYGEDLFHSASTFSLQMRPSASRVHRRSPLPWARASRYSPR